MAEAYGRREIPFRGEIRELVIVGNGKDCVLQVRVPDGRAFAIPMSRALASVTCCDGVVVDTEESGDDGLEIRYQPVASRRLRLVSATVVYPGTEADWVRDCEHWERMRRVEWPPESSWAVLGIDVTLATFDGPGENDDFAGS